MMRYILSSNDLIILRDGRPFGQPGVFGGVSLDWPLPQTLAGMCRTAVGHERSRNYFTDPAGCKSILSLGLAKLLPCFVSSGHGEPLIPTPADLLFSGEGEDIQVHPFHYRAIGDGEGTDLDRPYWLYPFAGLKTKPLASPQFLRCGLAEQYIVGELDPSGTDTGNGRQTVQGTVKELRIHSAIDPETRGVQESKLFAESGMYLASVSSTSASNRTRQDVSGEIRIGFELQGLEENDRLPGTVYLGGERRTAFIEPGEPDLFPLAPEGFDNQRFLKLVLTTHGDFSGWCPDWLTPSDNSRMPAWVQEPLSGVDIRLRSAVVAGWEPVSGWDYAEKKQKPLRKLVRPGTIYLVELKEPGDSRRFTEKLWGESICQQGSQEARDGFGQVLIAKPTIVEHEKENR